MTPRQRTAEPPDTSAELPDRGRPYSICMIGNSHLAIFYKAWRTWPEPLLDKVSLSFFPAKTPLLDTISLRGSALVTSDRSLREAFEDSSGKKRIVLPRYDAFVLVGLRFNFNIAETCNKYGTVDQAKYGPVEQIIPEAMFTQLLHTQFEKSNASTIAGLIRQRSSAPVLICPVPLRPQMVLNDPEFAANARLRNAEFLKPVFDQFCEAAAAAATSRNCEVLWQDPQTIGLPGFTKSEYSRAASGDPRHEHDRWHMNDDYGRIHFAAVLKRLDELSGGRVLARETADPA
jgi:hypothetical protein